MIYNHNLIETKWKKYWADNHTYQFINEPNKPKFYALDMFPYPSGVGLHVGHLKGYLATEILVRYKKMMGFNILHPIGWDAFGLPAEQFAIKTGNHPNVFTQKNINNFRIQLQNIGFCFDYKKEVNTTDPNYYKTTQWIFLKLFKAGLAEIQNINVNWCPELKIVLANEEVILKNGKMVSERGEYLVEYKPMKQWVLKITKYADRLLEGLDQLDWPEGIKEHQRLWIGKKEKYQFEFSFFDQLILLNLDYSSNIFLIKGVLVNQHTLIVKYLCKNYLTAKKIIKNYFDDINQKNNLTLDYYISHDKFKIQVPIILSKNLDPKNSEIQPYFNCDENQLVDQKKEAEFLAIYLNKTTKKVITYKLRDWIFSRQRYWGEPIPIYYDQKNNIYLENNLPLILPQLEKIIPTQNGQSPLVHAYDWIQFQENNQTYTRESNTMPNWAGSCWYYLGYLLKNSDQSYIPIDSQEAYNRFSKWLPVDVYIGGQEHAVLHLLYARFWHMFLYDNKIVPTPEPFYRLINQGMILGPDGQKMSKSLGNVINPNDIIETHGADTIRLYECFMGPVTSSMPWSQNGLNAMRKWIDRVYNTFMRLHEFKLLDDENLDFLKIESQLLNKFVSSLNRFSLNVGVSEMMIFINHINEKKQYTKRALKTFVQIFSMYAPFLGEELWSNFLNQKTSVYKSKLSVCDKKYLIKIEIELPVTINNKFICTILTKNNAAQETLKSLILELPKIKNKIKNKTIHKIVYVPQKIFNIIIK